MLIGKNIVLVFIVLLFNGCTLKSGLYKPNFNSINEIKEYSIQPMTVDTGIDKTKVSPKIDEVTIRGSKLISAYGNSFSEYLNTSIEEQLKSSKLYEQGSAIRISAIFLKNEFDGSSIITGTADLSANFIVYNQQNKIYEKVHTIHHEWESSFAGMTAIPIAVENYPIAIQKLIDSFMLDKEFIEVVEKK